MTTITIRGVAELAAALNEPIDELMRPVLIGVANEAQTLLAKYPATLPGQRYIRGYGYPGGPRTSEGYGRKFQITPMNRSAVLLNLASYGGYVGSAQSQARVHRGRWVTDQEAATKVERQGIAQSLFEEGLRKRFP
jgi:hypothetical protein